MVHARWLRPRPVPPILETYRAAAGVPPETLLRPWLQSALTESERARARPLVPADAAEGFVLFGVGARWETKRWPARHFVSLATSVRATLGLGARMALAPGDAALERELRALLPPERHAEIVCLEFREAAALASFATAIVSNDSALLHLGPALGVPALAIFGSTVPAFGFAPRGPRDGLVEIPLSCRPCDVHGKRRCPLGHHGCMERLTPDRPLEVLRSMLEPAHAAT
jgi:heptosyltransferase-2